MAVAALSMRSLFSVKLSGLFRVVSGNGGAVPSTSAPSFPATLVRGRMFSTVLQQQRRDKREFLFMWCSKYGTAAVDSKDSDNDDGVGKRYVELTDQELMSQCQLSTFKASGPGGQHRNKRESAVRLKHLPTGIVAQAVEDRSQHMNRASALARLRCLLALKVEGSVSDAAKYLGLSTGALSRLILSDDSLRMAVNELRTSKGMKPLK